MWCGFVTLLLHGTGWISRALSRPFWRSIATLGYGIYLVHVPICDHVIVPAARALQARDVPMTVIWPCSLAVLCVLSAGLAYFMHILIEKPSLRVRERLAG
jgi:peptidoglycan/LPS O-acetylase OafA/YrhL